jgi:hypothetical protein
MRFVTVSTDQGVRLSTSSSAKFGGRQSNLFSRYLRKIEYVI